MKTRLAVFAAATLAALGACSCRTTSPEPPTIPVTCVVQPESGAVYEITLDGKLVGSGKATPHSQQCVNFEAARGEHLLLVTAAGMEPYQRTIAVTGAGKNLQTFFVELKPSGH